MTSTRAAIKAGGFRNVIPEKYRMFLGALFFFLLMLGVFTISAPQVFLSYGIFGAVFISLPIFIMIAVSGVFLVSAGEVDLSFPSVITVCALVFASCIQLGLSPWLALPITLLAGIAAGALNSFLVVILGLSSLIATLGTNFAFIGITRIIQSSTPIDIRVVTADYPFFRDLFVGKSFGIPHQMFWGIGFAIVAWFLYNRHKIGVAVRIAGDNPQAGMEMGLNIKFAKSFGFLMMGFAAGMIGMFVCLINQSFLPSLGEGYLLPGLAAIFVGGTPIWGGVGTIAGAVIGAATVAFIESGIIASGLTGFFTQFVFGVVIVLSLLGHRIFQGRSARYG
jgi:ribose/xylose/arabinose/galactoside ABC-type transport system permease subunit